MINTISFPNLGFEFTVSRAAFTLGGINIYWYGIIIALGLVLALVYGVYEFGRRGLDRDDLLNMFLFAVPAAIVGARLYYVIFNFDAYRYDLLSVFDIRGGGLAVYGGIIAAALTVFIYCRCRRDKKISLGEVLDILAVGLLLGQAIGRWGNFVNGEAFGSVTDLPWAMTIVSDGETVASSVHPTFLYESLWNIIGFVALLIYRKHKKFSGEVFAAYILWYGLGRVWIEALRTDSLLIGSVRVSQIVAVISIIAGAAIIAVGRHKNKNNISEV